MSPVALSMAAALATGTLGVGAWRLSRGGDRQRARIKRRLSTLAAGRPAAASEVKLVFAKPAPKTSLSARLLAQLQAIVGYDPAVPKRPMPNWLAVVMAIGVARGVVWLATSLVGPLGWACFPIAGFVLLRGYFVWCTRRWRDSLFKQFPDALSTIVRMVRVGISLPDSMRRVATEAPEPTAEVFRAISNALTIGTPLLDAMATATARTGMPEYRFFTTALVLQNRTGGGLAATLEGLADVIRRRVMVRARGKALASEARASAVVLAVLPVVTVAAMMVISPGYMGPLFTEATGHTILAGAILTEGLGIFVMRTIIVRSLS